MKKNTHKMRFKKQNNNNTHCALCSPEEVLSMQEFAKSMGMEIIPLVQTFGHLEVKLKP